MIIIINKTTARPSKCELEMSHAAPRRQRSSIINLNLEGGIVALFINGSMSLVVGWEQPVNENGHLLETGGGGHAISSPSTSRQPATVEVKLNWNTLLRWKPPPFTAKTKLSAFLVEWAMAQRTRDTLRNERDRHLIKNRILFKLPPMASSNPVGWTGIRMGRVRFSRVLGVLRVLQIRVELRSGYIRVYASR